MKRLLLTCTDLMAIQFLVPHVKYLSEHGFSVELACSEVGGRLQELRTVLSGIAPVHTVRLVRNPFSLRNRKGLSDLKKIINGRSWDVIWTNEPVMGVMTRVAAKTVRKKAQKSFIWCTDSIFIKVRRSQIGCSIILLKSIAPACAT